MTNRIYHNLLELIPLSKDTSGIVIEYCMPSLNKVINEYFVPPGKSVMSIETTILDWFGTRLTCRERSGTKNKDLYIEINAINVIIRQKPHSTLILVSGQEIILPKQKRWKITYRSGIMILRSKLLKYKVSKIENFRP